MAGHDYVYKHSREVGVGARIAAIRRWEVETRHAHEIRQDLEDFSDMGLLEEEIGPVTCGRCHAVIEPGESFCRYCGAEPGEQDAVNEPDPDEEFLWDELTPVHGHNEEMEAEIPVESGIVEKLQEPLIELGWVPGEAEYAAVLLARIFERDKPLDCELYPAALRSEVIPENRASIVERLLAPDVQHHMLGILKGQSNKTSEQLVAVKADIHIFRGDGDEWRVEVEDLLADQIAVKPLAKVQLGDLSLSLEKYLETLQPRPKRLRVIGEQLLHHFREEFFEQGIEQANKALNQRAMEQKKVAQTADMPESTFSRWCDPREGGVWVSTPHGPYHLGDFFERTASTDRSMKSSRAGVIALVIEAKRELGDEIPDLGEKLSKASNNRIREWLEGHDVKMAERTLRGYWKEGYVIARLAGAMRKVGRLGQIEDNGFLDRLRKECDVDFDGKQLDNYLLMAQFYEEQRWGSGRLLGSTD